ncbi:hypothetical protein QQF64_029053 [Cirrhinus molitorella]|uniref:Uncharacterized protein n=2 Tax=Cirrhinus molitorella TaxID=172907 RepID=A0AA88TKW3_9TELE|nr:hypothetical protein Q8A67_014316 [Cirrhinus molitorella]
MPLARSQSKPASDWTANVSHSGRGLLTVRQNRNQKCFKRENKRELGIYNKVCIINHCSIYSNEEEQNWSRSPFGFLNEMAGGTRQRKG